MKFYSVMIGISSIYWCFGWSARHLIQSASPCQQVVFLVNPIGKVGIENNNILLKKGDAVLIKTGISGLRFDIVSFLSKCSIFKNKKVLF